MCRVQPIKAKQNKTKSIAYHWCAPVVNRISLQSTLIPSWPGRAAQCLDYPPARKRQTCPYRRQKWHLFPSQSVRVFSEGIISSIMSWSYTRDYQPFYGQICTSHITTLNGIDLLKIYSIVRDSTFPSNSIVDRCFFPGCLLYFFVQAPLGMSKRTGLLSCTYMFLSLVWFGRRRGKCQRAGGWMVFVDCLFCLELWLTVRLTRELKFIFSFFLPLCPGFPESPVPHDRTVDRCVPLQGFCL